MRSKVLVFVVAAIAVVGLARGHAWAIGEETPGAGINGTIHDFVNGGFASSNTYTVGQCTFCHTAHGGLSTNLLWNHQLSGQTYQWDVPATTAGTLFPIFADKVWNGPTAKCLSCHDGTVAVGAVNWFNSGYGQPGSHGAYIINPRTASLKGLTNTGTSATLSGVHPVAMPYPWGGVPSTYNGTTTGANFNPGDWNTPPAGRIRIYTENGANSVVLGYNGINPQKTTPNLNGNAGIECSSCHDAHNKNTVDGYYLLGMGTGSGSTYLCTMCHSK